MEGRYRRISPKVNVCSHMVVCLRCQDVSGVDRELWSSGRMPEVV